MAYEAQSMTDGGEQYSSEKTIVRARAGERGPMEPPYLVIADGPRRGTRFPLSMGENLVGRGPWSHILLEDQSVSRRHCVFERTADGVSAADQDSKNGTYVNGQATQDKVILGHGDLVQVGMYTLRLINREVTPEEELAPVADSDESSIEAEEKVAEPSMETSAMTEEELAASAEEDGDADYGEEVDAEDADDENEEESESDYEEGNVNKWRKWIVPAVVVLVLLGGSIWGYIYFNDVPDADKKLVARTVPKDTSAISSEETENKEPTTIPVFVDFAASPMPAQVKFQGKDYGLTPVKINIPLTIGEEYTAEGTFVMPQFKEERIERVTFVLEASQSLIPVFFRAPIGMFKVEKLPREVELSLQAYFAYDQFTPRSTSLTDIAYGKPMYFPYGRYIIELRHQREIGASGSFVPDIIYRREVLLSEDSPTFSLNIEADELTHFPVEIRSTPSNAEVFIDAKKVGKTPYSDNFPLGRHTLVVRKDGYFEHAQTVENDINVPTKLNITLRTTEAGEFINDGRKLVLQGRFKEAVRTLSQVFEKGPGALETAEAQYFLATAFLGLGDLETANSYFVQASTHEDFALKAKLGQVRILARQDKRLEALPLLVEIMMRAEESNILEEARAAFKEVSPLKSVIYVRSEPAGATVFVNEDKMQTPTPLILHDLGLGNYKVRLEKEGFQPQVVNINLSIHEFNPVIVKLKPATDE